NGLRQFGCQSPRTRKQYRDEQRSAENADKRCVRKTRAIAVTRIPTAGAGAFCPSGENCPAAPTLPRCNYYWAAARSTSNPRALFAPRTNSNKIRLADATNHHWVARSGATTWRIWGSEYRGWRPAFTRPLLRLLRASRIRRDRRPRPFVSVCDRASFGR